MARKKKGAKRSGRHVKTLFDEPPRCPKRAAPARQAALNAGIAPHLADEVAAEAVRRCRTPIPRIVNEYVHGDDLDEYDF
jgi:hypothetical protein